MQGVLIETVGYEGSEFSDFFAGNGGHTGPGWYVFGRNKTKYGVNHKGEGNYVMLCARPDVPLRKYPNWNPRVRRGWHTKREAQAIADRMNAGER